jgi:hypothetical protein
LWTLFYFWNHDIIEIYKNEGVIVMGLDYNHYVLLGVDVENKRTYIRDNEDVFLPYIEGRYGIEMELIDDRKFIYFGKVVARGNRYEGITKTEMDPSELDHERQKVADEYVRLFGESCSIDRVKIVACTVIW